MAIIRLRDRRRVNVPVRNKYKQNGYQYGFVSVDGRVIEVCQSTVVNGEKQWDEVLKAPEDHSHDDDILTY